MTRVNGGSHIPKVIHFEIPADDTKRAIEFYSKVFGWEIEKWGPIDYWNVRAGKDDEPGINGAISPRSELPAARNTISVPSIEEFADKITKAGGKVVSPKMTIPGFGYLASCIDTEGNAFNIMQQDPKAK